MSGATRFSPEVRELAVRLVSEKAPGDPSPWAAMILPIAPSMYSEQKVRAGEPAHLPALAQRDAALRPGITRVRLATERRHGAKKLWQELRRERVRGGATAGLYRALGRRGVVRGRRVKTTITEPMAAQSLDLVQRHFNAMRPMQL